jgi:hypothetical protein
MDNLTENKNNRSTPTVIREVLTPSKAREYLQHNIGNRAFVKSRIAQYRKSMETGLWIEQPQGPAFDFNGVLFNGQNTLAALSEIEEPFELVLHVGYNFHPDARHVIDGVKPRNNIDTTAIMGGNLVNRDVAHVITAIADVAFSSVPAGKQKEDKFYSGLGTRKDVFLNQHTAILVGLFGDSLNKTVSNIRKWTKEGCVSCDKRLYALYFCCSELYGEDEADYIFARVLKNDGLAFRSKEWKVYRRLLKMKVRDAESDSEPEPAKEKENGPIKTKELVRMFLQFFVPEVETSEQALYSEWGKMQDSMSMEIVEVYDRGIAFGLASEAERKVVVQEMKQHGYKDFWAQQSSSIKD